MRYFLKKDLPGVKAGTEMERAVPSSGGEIGSSHMFRPGSVVKISGALPEEMWKGKESDIWHRIPNSELSDWIGGRADGTWKPREGEDYYVPMVVSGSGCGGFTWNDDDLDARCFSRGLVCPTPELAIELHDRMIETAKKFWEEKK